MLEMLTSRMGDHRTEAGREFLKSRSPLTYADRIRKPLLIGQGANDPRVKLAESDQIVQAMQAKKRKLPAWIPLMPVKLARKPWRVAWDTAHMTAGPGVTATRVQVARYRRNVFSFIKRQMDSPHPEPIRD